MTATPATPVAPEVIQYAGFPLPEVERKAREQATWDDLDAAARAEPKDQERHSDTGNATIFAEQNAGQVHYVPRWKRWLVWRDHAWHIDHDDVHVLELAKNVARQLIRDAAEITDPYVLRRELSHAQQSFNVGRRHDAAYPETHLLATMRPWRTSQRRLTACVHAAAAKRSGSCPTVSGAPCLRA